ncbi:hypothetical protein [Halorubrum sp. 2020YC2]|uniref:hypothetical protein n=1 Tax=Halorubrum sp. 2020YC2 TaxID=2836432 RepID=UPI001BE7898E|nr:hypothetical protein [Halorubrum sp. 2020YC2]QWC18726.1 hypothetical protein KI388_11415 [Halorubrum sp. 2020YC2]
MTDEPPADGPDSDPADDRMPAEPATDRDPTRDPPQPMTDDTDRTTTDSDRTETSDDWEPADSSGFDRPSTDDLRGLLDRVGLAALSLLAVVAGWGFYTQSGSAIRTWFDPAYQSVALAVFNLAVLLVALAGVTHQLRRIRATESGGSE